MNRDHVLAIIAAILYRPARHNGSPAELSSLRSREDAARENALDDARDFLNRAEQGLGYTTGAHGEPQNG